MIIRPAEPEDSGRMVEWSVSTPSNGFDPDIASYPHLYTIAIEDEHGPLMYVPTHPVLVVESVACRPDITAKGYIKALLDAKAVTEGMALQNGIREIYTSSTFTPMYKTLRRHGYTPVSGSLRKKL